APGLRLLIACRFPGAEQRCSPTLSRRCDAASCEGKHQSAAAYSFPAGPLSHTQSLTRTT
ncbi:hypothetical protein V5799_004524, partial [Amblyomma americanum]